MYYMIENILPYSFLVSIGIFCACLIYKSFFGINKVVIGILIFSISTFLLNIQGIHYLNSTRPHRMCNVKIEMEALNIASAIASYFSEPQRTQFPCYNDLIKSGDYSLEGVDLKRREKLFKESEFSIAILDGDVNEIPIVVSSKEGKCPFEKGKCLRRFKGKFFVLKMGDYDSGVWLDSYEDI